MPAVGVYRFSGDGNGCVLTGRIERADASAIGAGQHPDAARGDFRWDAVVTSAPVGGGRGAA